MAVGRDMLVRVQGPVNLCVHTQVKVAGETMKWALSCAILNACLSIPPFHLTRPCEILSRVPCQSCIWCAYPHLAFWLPNIWSFLFQTMSGNSNSTDVVHNRSLTRERETEGVWKQIAVMPEKQIFLSFIIGKEVSPSFPMLGWNVAATVIGWKEGPWRGMGSTLLKRLIMVVA